MTTTWRDENADEGSLYAFTVFTPTYNRSSTLNRVYESLFSQTFRNFEWVIVDDGSKDNTKLLVDQWESQSPFPIRYFWQQNQGKPAAFNLAVRNARGQLFICLDSDDSCEPTALERFAFHWSSIPPKLKTSFCGVTSLCKDEFGVTVGTSFPRDVLDSDSIEIRHRYKVTGEKWGFMRTDILREHPFPILDENKLFLEGVIWSKIARKYKTRFVNEVLRTYWCHQNGASYSTDSVNKHANALRLWNINVLNEEIQWLRYNPFGFLRAAINYSRFSFHSGAGLKNQYNNLSNKRGKSIWLVGALIGLILFTFDKRRN